AKGDPANYWLLVSTVDTDGRFCRCELIDCYIGYRVRITNVSKNAWTPVTVKWSDLALPIWVSQHPPFNAGAVVAISVGGIGTAYSFDVAIDNLRLAH